LASYLDGRIRLVGVRVRACVNMEVNAKPDGSEGRCRRRRPPGAPPNAARNPPPTTAARHQPPAAAATAAAAEHGSNGGRTHNQTNAVPVMARENSILFSWTCPPAAVGVVSASVHRRYN
jgi:hypothetical protein